MNSNVIIPKGDEKITVELSLKEAMALTGVRFNENHELMLDARRKLQQTIEEKYKNMPQ